MDAGRLTTIFRRAAKPRLVTLVTCLGLLGCRPPERDAEAQPAEPAAPPPTEAADLDPMEAAFVQRLKAHDPSCRATKLEPLRFDVECPPDARLEMFLGNLEAEIRALSAEDRQLRIDEWIGLALQPLADIDRRNLVPLVRHVELKETFGRVEDAPVTMPLAGDLMIVFAFDAPRMLQMARRSDLEGLGLGEDALKVAIDNVVARLGNPEIHSGDGDLHMITWGGTFEATLLLVPNVWDELEKTVPGDLVVAVPARDLLFFTGADSRSGLDALDRMLARVRADEVAYPLSSVVLRRSGGQWSEFER